MFWFDAHILQAALLLLLVMDPLGNVPIFLSLLKDIDQKRRRRIIMRELLIALVIMLLFLYFGQNILDVFSLQQESVRISGGIVLFLIALRMIFPSDKKLAHTEEAEPFIVPLAIPLVAGPSTIATLILMTRQESNQSYSLLLALLLAWSVTAIILMSAPWLYRVLKSRGLAAMERLMGMLLIMLSVQMLIDGIQNLYLAMSCK